MERFDCVALVKGYLQGVQKENIAEVNEALNALYVEEEDYDALRGSINKYKTFDQIGLAERTQKHEARTHAHHSHSHPTRARALTPDTCARAQKHTHTHKRTHAPAHTHRSYLSSGASPPTCTR